MVKKTSKRHTEVLNKYQAGEGGYYNWTQKMLGALEITSWDYGRVSMSWDIDDHFVMPDGIMFGGHVANVADQIASLAAMSALEESTTRFRTSRLETNYFRPVMRPSAIIEARATNVSKTLIHVEADILTPDEKLAVRVYAVQVLRPKPAE